MNEAERWEYGGDLSRIDFSSQAVEGRRAAAAAARQINTFALAANGMEGIATLYQLAAKLTDENPGAARELRRLFTEGFICVVHGVRDYGRPSCGC